jgi:anti-sigma B factor antagonist
MARSRCRTRPRHLSVVPDTTPARTSDDITLTVDRASDLEINTISRNSDTTVQLSGELDFSNASLLGSVVDTQVRLGCREMRLDLSLLAFCDCTGLRAVVHAHNLLRSLSGGLVITGVGPSLEKLLTLTHLDEALNVERSEEPATRPVLTMVGSAERAPGPR